MFFQLMITLYIQASQARTKIGHRLDYNSRIKVDTIIPFSYNFNEVVISASRKRESLLKTSISIEKINGKSIKNSAAFSFFDALENVKGVQVITPSLGFKIINTRGFANTTNVRFTQLIDGIDNMAPEIGAPIGNSFGPTDLDISSIEIIPGTTSSLYGLNSLNGLANFITRDPFKSSGLSFQQKIGINHLNDVETGEKIFNESSIRWDQMVNDRFAYKINFNVIKGYDWISNNPGDQNALVNAKLGLPSGPNNPGFDPINGYGNESSDRKTLILQGKQYVVSRTGYLEKEVTPYDLQNLKFDFMLSYKSRNKTRYNFTSRFADINSIFQRANKFRLKDYILAQQVFEVKNDLYQARAFWTVENTGLSYNLRSAAENVDRNFKPDYDWFNDFTSGYNASISSRSDIIQAFKDARIKADAGRYLPGTLAFTNKLEQLTKINNWDIGAALRVKDDLFHIEGQAELGRILFPSFKKKTKVDFWGGFDVRTFLVVPDGNYFINFVAANPYTNFTYSKRGIFLSANWEGFHQTFKVSGTLRTERNDFFNIKFSPQITLIYSPIPEQNFRFSFQSGYRYPSLFEGFSNVISGGIRRIGGLRIASHGVFENAFTALSITNFQNALKNDFNTGISTIDAIQKEKGLLVKSTYSYTNPEHINSLEVGYKAQFFNKQLNVDMDYYFNRYDHFIAQVNINVPKTNLLDSIPYYLLDKNLQNPYRVWTNSLSTVYNFGGSLGLNYLFWKKYVLAANATYARLQRTSQDDALEDGFNTPPLIFNIALIGNQIYKDLGFNLTYKWQQHFFWQSFLVNGMVPSYGNIDFQFNYDLPKSHLNIKLGASNVLNKYYNSILGGPSIGGLYYTTITYRGI